MEIPPNMPTRMFITALVTIAKRGCWVKCPSKDEWINRLWFIKTDNYWHVLKCGGTLKTPLSGKSQTRNIAHLHEVSRMGKCIEIMVIGSCQERRGGDLMGLGLASGLMKLLETRPGPALVKNTVNGPNAAELCTWRWLILLRQPHFGFKNFVWYRLNLHVWS